MNHPVTWHKETQSQVNTLARIIIIIIIIIINMYKIQTTSKILSDTTQQNV